MRQLREKHPAPQPEPAKVGSLLFGPVDDNLPESIYLTNRFHVAVLLFNIIIDHR